MNEIPLHPALVHVPLGIAFVLPIVTLIALAIGWRKKQVTPWIFVLVLNAIVAGSGWYAGATGEEIEDGVEEFVGYDLIHEHEERAEVFVILAWVGTAVAAGTVLAPVHKLRLGLGASSAVLAFGLAFLGFGAGKSGGQIVHGEGVRWAGVALDEAEVGHDDDGVEGHDEGDHGSQGHGDD